MSSASPAARGMVVAGQLLGALWTSPNTLCGLLAGTAGLAFGARVR